MPLNHLGVEQARYEVLDSPLSEAGILGLEFGYSLDLPESLVIWEAQFGDFANGAQVIIDQFIATTEDKWHRLSGLVMLLPHGFEGQGPEHSSARLERFLALCADDNMQVVNLTTPAQLFHCLRRQVHRPYRKPLIVMSPKSLLRHPKAISTLSELTQGAFHPFIRDPQESDVESTDRVVLCSGKFYYDLQAAREEGSYAGLAVDRIEQLYPIDSGVFEDLLGVYPSGTPVVWAQVEPENMGAWPYLRTRFGDSLCGGKYPMSVAARQPSASPATGSSTSHKAEQKSVLKRALTVSTPSRGKNKAQSR